MELLLTGVIALALVLILGAIGALLFLQLRGVPGGAQSEAISERLSRIEPMTQSIQVSLAQLEAYSRARHDLERRTAEAIGRLEAVIAGTQSKGAAWENILEVVFSRLPAEWQVRNFRVGNRTVEFGLRLPNRLLLPIDSKWPATGLAEALAGSEDPIERQRLKAQIQSEVLGRAREVKKYVDPDITVNFGLVTVPDSVFELCPVAQVEALQMNVVLISHSMFIPYLLLVFQTFLKTSHEVDLQKLEAYLDTAQESLEALQDELEGRFARALVMLANSRDDMRAHVSRVGGGLTGLRLGAPANDYEGFVEESEVEGRGPGDIGRDRGRFLE